MGHGELGFTRICPTSKELCSLISLLTLFAELEFSVEQEEEMLHALAEFLPTAWSPCM